MFLFDIIDGRGGNEGDCVSLLLVLIRNYSLEFHTRYVNFNGVHKIFIYSYVIINWGHIYYLSVLAAGWLAGGLLGIGFVCMR